MTWSIDVVQARSICQTTAAHAAQIDEVATTAANAFDAAQVAVTRADQTSAALAEIGADPFFIRLAGMRRHVTTVTQTTEAVIDLYEAGDLEMATDTQSTMNGLEP